MKIETVKVGVDALRGHSFPYLLNIIFEANDAGLQGYVVDNVFEDPDGEVDLLLSKASSPYLNSLSFIAFAFGFLSASVLFISLLTFGVIG
jgi:hypothetical protein